MSGDIYKYHVAFIYVSQHNIYIYDNVCLNFDTFGTPYGYASWTRPVAMNARRGRVGEENVHAASRPIGQNCRDVCTRKRRHEP